MKIDIQTLSFVLSICIILQVIALYVQYRINRSKNGTGWWVMGSISMALGILLLLAREINSIELISIMVSNTFVVMGQLFLYIGLVRFLDDKKENRRLIIALFVVFLLPFFYYTYIENSYAGRTVVVTTVVAVISFLIAYKLFINKDRSLFSSTRFLGVVFLAYGCLVMVRVILTLVSSPVSSLFEQSLIQVLAFLVPFVASTLWTFGLILLVNQQLNGENREAKENLELIFNTIPDAVMITRLTDGYFVGINDGFTKLTGYRRDDVMGKSSLDIHLWEDTENRKKFVSVLNEEDF